MAQRGRPRVYKPNRVTTALRLDPQLLKRLKIEAVKRDVSVNVIADKALHDWLKKNEGKVRL